MGEKVRFIALDMTRTAYVLLFSVLAAIMLLIQLLVSRSLRDTCLGFYLLQHGTFYLLHLYITKVKFDYSCTILFKPSTLHVHNCSQFSTTISCVNTVLFCIGTYRLHTLLKLACSKHKLLKLFGMQTTKQELKGNLPGQRTGTSTLHSLPLCHWSLIQACVSYSCLLFGI